jgi:hypothetical protein
MVRPEKMRLLHYTPAPHRYLDIDVDEALEIAEQTEA